MKKTGASKPMHCDKQGHPLAFWDNHASCRTCLRGVGIYCTRSMTCDVCSDWTDEMWDAFEDAEYRSNQKRERRRRIREAKEAAVTAARARLLMKCLNRNIWICEKYSMRKEQLVNTLFYRRLPR